MTGAVALVLAGAALTISGASAAPDRNLQIARAFVAKRCHPGSAQSAGIWQAGWTFNALYGDCGGGDGRDQHIWFFAGGRFVGMDAPGSSGEIIGLWRDRTTIAFLYVLYRPSDALCCPTGGGKVVRFRWNGRRVVAMDAIPARNASTSGPAGRYP